MEKKLYWSLSDNVELSGLILELSGCMEHIAQEMTALPEEDQAMMEYNLTPVWMTEEEFNNLPEYQF